MRTRRAALGITLVAVTLGVALSGLACSSSTTTATEDPPKPTSTQSTITLTEAQQKQVLQAGLLTAADLGEGWAETIAAGNRAVDADTFSFMLAEPACAKVLQALSKNEATDKTLSPRFTKSGAALTAENSVTVLKNQTNAEKLVIAINRESSNECLDKAFDRGMRKVFETPTAAASDASSTTLDPKQVEKVTSVRVKKFSGLTVGQLRAGFEVTVDVQKGDEPIRKVIVTRVAAQEGPAILDFTFGAEGNPFPDPVTAMAGPVGRVENIVSPGFTSSTATPSTTG